MFKALHRYATAGSAVWVTAKIAHDWAIIMGLIVGGSTTALAYWDWGTKFGYAPLVLVGIVAAAGTIWIIIGIRMLWRRGTPTTPKMSFDYAYGLALVRMHLGKDDADDQSYIQPGVVWKCAGPAALKYHVDHFRIVIGDRTSEGAFGREGVIPRDCEITFFHPSFTKAQIVGLGAKAPGIVEYRVRYGHPEHGYLRAVTARLRPTFRLDDKHDVVYLIESIVDEEIKS